MIFSSLYNIFVRTSTKHPPNSLRNMVNFPTFASLPHEYAADPPHWKEVSPYNFVKARHWCFLGEIVEVIPWVRLMLRLNDKDGATALMAFHDDRRGKAFAEACKAGRTVAVLDPLLHPFADGSHGIRIENNHIEERRVKVLPFALQAMLKANDKAIEAMGGDEKCTQCGNISENLPLRCSKCGTRYCTKVIYTDTKLSVRASYANIYDRNVNWPIGNKSIRTFVSRCRKLNGLRSRNGIQSTELSLFPDDLEGDFCTSPPMFSNR